MTLTMSRADIQARQIRIAIAAKGWDVTDLHDALRDAGYAVSYEKLRRAVAGERERELEFDVCKWIAEVTDFSVEFIQGESIELPDWVVNIDGKHRFRVVGLPTHTPIPIAA